MSRWGLRLALLLVILGAFALRLWRLDGQELRGDEAFGYFFSLEPLWAMVEQTLALGEPHPVASYWLQRGWLRLAGDGEFALRFPSAWWSTLAVALLARLGQALGMGTRASVGAALLLAVSPYALWHAHDARMYSMSLALTLAAVVAAVRWWARPGYAAALGYIGAAGLALHTHYYAGFVLAIPALVGLFWAYWSQGRRAALAWLAIQGGLALLYLPWVIAALPVVMGYGGNGDSPGLGAALARAAAAMTLGEVQLPPGRMVWAALLAVGAAFGLGSLLQGESRSRAAGILLLLYALVPLVATWFGARTRPIYDERYLVAAAPPVYLLAAALVGPRGARGATVWAGYGVIGVLLAGMAVSSALTLTDPAYSKDRDWRALAQRLESYSQGYAPQAVRLVQNYPDPTLWYYYRGAVPHAVLPPKAHDAAAAAALVDEFANGGVQRLVFVAQPSAAWDASSIALDALRAHYDPLMEAPLAGWTVYILERSPSLDPVSVQYQNGLQVTGVAIGAQAAAPGGVLAVHVRFEAQNATLTGSEKVSIQVEDGRGTLAAQEDLPLATGTPATGWVSGYGILLPPSLSGPEVQVNLVIYDPGQAMARVHTVAGEDVLPLARLPVMTGDAPGPH